MARIAGVSARDGGVLVKLAHFFTRRTLARLTGREPERMVEPLEMFAHAPGLLAAYGRLERAALKLNRVDKRLSDRAELKAPRSRSASTASTSGRRSRAAGLA
jgi:hypothetical protein